jgi:hypothetical protein
MVINIVDLWMAGLAQCIVSGGRKAEPCFSPFISTADPVVECDVAMEPLEVNIERNPLTIKERLKMRLHKLRKKLHSK